MGSEECNGSGSKAANVNWSNESDEVEEEKGVLLKLLLEMLAENCTAVIRANRGFGSYYLVNVLQTPKELKEDKNDDYKNVDSVGTGIIWGNYYELLINEAKQTYWFVDNTKTCLFCSGICPDLPWFYQKREAEPINAFHAVDPVHDW